MLRSLSLGAPIHDNGGPINFPCRAKKAKEGSPLENMNKTPFQEDLSVSVHNPNQRNEKPESKNPVKKLPLQLRYDN